MSASSIGSSPSSSSGGEQSAPSCSTEKSTFALKFLHLYQGFAETGKSLVPGLRVMVLGLGSVDLPVKGGRIVQSCPQAAEMSYFMQGPNQVLDLVDKDPELLGRIQAGNNYYDPIPASNFFTTYECSVPGKKNFEGTFMKARIGKVQAVRGLINTIILGQKGMQKAPPTRRYLDWDPQISSPLPVEMNDTYDVIIATASALFPKYISNGEKREAAWRNILAMLKNRGLLYVDARSFRGWRKHPEIQTSFEQILESRFLTKKLSPLAEVSEGAKICFSPRTRDNGKPEKYPILQMKTEVDGSYKTTYFDTYSIYVIERVIDKMEELKQLYPSPNKMHYLHYLAKNTFKAELYTSEKLLKNVSNVKEGYPYISEHHGWTPLHVAVFSNNAEAIRFFLSGDFPEMQQKDEYEKTPADYARIYQPHLYQRFFM